MKIVKTCPNLIEENHFGELFFQCGISENALNTQFCKSLCLIENKWEDCEMVIDPNKLHNKGKWKEIVGLDHVKKKIIEKIQIPLLFPEKNVPPASSIVLFGPDGCGKSKIIKILSEETGAIMIPISLRNLDSVSAQVLQCSSPTIFVIDEIDIIAPPIDQREMFLTTFRMQDPLITLMGVISDIKNSKKPVVLIGISDNPDLISPMLLKQEYISELIYVNPPDMPARKIILKKFLEGKPLSPDISFDELAEKTKNYSIYDLSKLIKKTELNWIKKTWKEESEIKMEDFLNALNDTVPSITSSLISQFENVSRKYGVFEKEAKEKVLSWDDLGGYDSIKEQLQNIEGIFKGNQMAYKYKLRPPKGILLFGPPGCGKTYIAKILAATTDSNFQYASAPDLLSKWLGESEKNLRDIFSLAKISAPSILFFDELDGLAFERSRTTDHPYLSTLISTFLTEISNLNEDDQVLVIGATNRPEDIDPAFLRPGRLDERIAIPPPDEHAREKIFQIHLKNLPLEKDIDFKELSKRTNDYTGAEIEYICESTQRAVALDAMKSKKFKKIRMVDLIDQISHIKPDLTEDDIKRFEEISERFQRRGVVSSIKKIDEISFDNIGGMEDIIDKLKKSILLRLTHPLEVQEYGLPAKLGVILFGPPGTGKSLLNKALVKESNASYFMFSAVELINMFLLQDGRTKFHELLHDAERVAPSIIVLQNLEVIPAEVAIFITSEFNKLKKESAVVLICETTDLSRVGHLLQTSFEYMIPIYPPNHDQRIDIIKKMQKNFPTEKELDYDQLARKSENFVGADFLEVFRIAAQEALQRKISKDPKKLITSDDLLNIISSRKPLVSEGYLKAFERQIENFGSKKPTIIPEDKKGGFYS
ncbi:MAG: AAA family ATPase [Candidatus Lokiarchaeota archaeon]|nr:AAA family ATPase [Candidatus Lokiarchaeota archaeon]